MVALSAAASAVSLFGFAHRAMAQDNPTDTYSFIYNWENNPNGNPGGPLGTYNGDLTAVTNWYDLNSNLDGANTTVTQTVDPINTGATAPSSASTVEFDTNYANMNTNTSVGGPGQGGGNLGVTLSSVSATTWAAVNFISPANNNNWTNGAGTVVPFVLTVAGSTNAALTVGSGGISSVGNYQGNGDLPTDVVIAVPVNLGAAQSWTANQSVMTWNGTATNTTVLSTSGNLSLGGFGHSALTILGTGNVNLGGVVSDGGASSGIAMNGTGVLNLGSNNTFTGGLYLNSGTVSGSNLNAFGATGGLIEFNGGTLNPTGSAINNLNAYSVNGSAASSSATWSAVPLNLFISNAANTFTISQSLTSSTNLNQTGAGVIWITQATNSYTGGTTLAAGGTLVVQDLAALGTGQFLNSGTIDFTGNQTISGNQVGTAAVSAGAPVGSSPTNLFGTLTITNQTGSIVANQIRVQNQGNLVFDESHSNPTIPIAVGPSTGNGVFSTTTTLGTDIYGGTTYGFVLINNSGGTSLIANGGNITFIPNGSVSTVQVFSSTTFSGGANFITASGNVGQETIFLGNVTYDNTNSVGTFSVSQASTSSVVFNGPVTSSGVGPNGAFFGGTVASSDFAVVGNVYSAPGILTGSTTPGPGKGLVGYATYGLSDWAVVTQPNAGGTSYIVPGSAISGFYIHQSIIALATGTEPIYGIISRACASVAQDNIDVDCNGAANNANNSAPSSIRFNSPTGGLSIIGGQTALQWLCGNSSGALLECSDVLVTPNIGSQNVIFSDDVKATGGLSSAATQDFNPNGRSSTSLNAEIWNNDVQGNTAGMLILNTGITNGGFAGGVSFNGPGMLVLTTTGSYTGTTAVDGGTFEIQNNAFSGNATNQNSLNFFGGTFVTMQTTTLDASTFGGIGGTAGTARAVVVNVGGGDLAAIHTVVSGQTLAQILTVDGAISGNGNLNIGMGQVTAVMNNTVNSTLAFNKTSGNGKVILSGNASAFTGNIAVNFGTLQADGTYSSSTNFTANAGTTLTGASPSTLASVTANTGSTFYPGDNGTGVMTVASYTGNQNSTLAFGFSPATTASTDPLSITTTNGFVVSPSNTVWLSLLQTGTTQEYYGKGTYDLVNVFGSSNAFSINGTLALPGVGTQEISSDIGGLVIFDPFPKSTYALQTINSTQNPALSANETELQLTIVNTIITSIWGSASGGAFNVSTNWTNNQVPNGASDTAVFGSLPGTTIAVTMPASDTLGGVNFNTTNTYTISGTGPLAFANNGLDGAISMTNGNGHTQTISAPIDISGVPSLDLTVNNATDTLTLSGGIVDDGAGSGLSLNATNNGGAGTAILLGAQNFSGVISIGNQLGTGLGTLQFGNGSVAGTLSNNTAAINLNAGFLTFDEPSGTTVTLANTIVVPGAGGGTLLQEGTGSLLVLASSGAYNAPYPNAQLNAGTLRFSTAGSDNLGNFNQFGGLVDLNGQNASMASLTGTAGTIDNLSATSANLTVNNAVNGTYSGTIQNTSGSVTFIKDGTSTQVLAGVDTFIGGITLNQGGIQFNTQSSIPTQGTFTLNPTGNVGPILNANETFSMPILVNGGIQELVSLPTNGTTAEITGPITVPGGGGQYRMGFGNSQSMLYVTGTDVIQGAGSFFFFTEGNIQLINGYSMTNGIDGMTFGRAEDGTGGDTNLYVTMSGNASITQGSGGAGMGNASGSAMGIISLTLNNTSLLNLENPNNDGSSTFEMGGNGAATYQGYLTLNGGTLITGGILMDPNSATAATSTAIITFNGGVLEANGSSNNFLPPGAPADGYTGTGTAAPITLNVGTGGAHISTNGYNEVVNTTYGFAGESGDGGLVKEGGGILAFSLDFSGAANQQYQGPTVVDGGLLEVPGSSIEDGGNNMLNSTPYIQLKAGGGVGQDDGTITGPDSASGGGVLTLLANAPSAQAGFLALAGGTADTLTNINFNSASPVAGTYNMVTGAGGNLANLAIGALSDVGGLGTLGAAVAYTGTITPSTTGTYAHTYHLGGGGTLELTNANGTAALVGANALLAEYGGAVWLNTTNTYTGGTTINGTSVIDNDITGATMVEQTTVIATVLGDADTVPAGSSLGNPGNGGFNNPANLVINGGALSYVGTGDTSNLRFTIGQNGAEIDSSGSGTSGLVLQNTGTETFAAGDTGTITFTLGGSYGSTGFVNVFAGAFNTPPAGVTLSLVKNGVGEWNISGDTYNGGATINAGTLQLGSSVALVTSGPLVDNGTLDLNGFNTSDGPLSGNGVIDDCNTALANGSLTINTTGGTATFGGIIQNTSHSVSLALNGTGTQFFTGNSNTYAGGTNIGSGTTVTLNGGNGTLGGTPLGTGAIVDNGTLNFNRSDTTFSLVNSITGTGSFNMSGSGTLSLTGNPTYSGTTGINNGTLLATAPGQLSANSSIINNSNLEILGGTSASPIVSGNISGTGNLIIGNTTTPSYLKLGASTHTSSVNWTGLQIASNSTLDIANDSLDINYAGVADPVSSVVGLLINGYGSGNNWKGGSGILSSTAAAGGLLPILSVGYADGNNPYDAARVAGLQANQILIRYTLAGDANLDYNVNFNDLLIVAQNFNKSGQDWVQGNFIYSTTVGASYSGLGTVNFADLLIVAQNFNKVLSPVGSEGGADGGGGIIGLSGSVSSQDAGIPEPGSLALIAGASAGLLARRRRRTSK